jgi:hypothetical protein
MGRAVSGKPGAARQRAHCGHVRKIRSCRARMPQACARRAPGAHGNPRVGLRSCPVWWCRRPLTGLPERPSRFRPMGRPVRRASQARRETGVCAQRRRDRPRRTRPARDQFRSVTMSSCPSGDSRLIRHRVACSGPVSSTATAGARPHWWRRRWANLVVKRTASAMRADQAADRIDVHGTACRAIVVDREPAPLESRYGIRHDLARIRGGEALTAATGHESRAARTTPAHHSRCTRHSALRMARNRSTSRVSGVPPVPRIAAVRAATASSSGSGRGSGMCRTCPSRQNKSRT